MIKSTSTAQHSTTVPVEDLLISVQWVVTSQLAAKNDQQYVNWSAEHYRAGRGSVDKRAVRDGHNLPSKIINSKSTGQHSTTVPVEDLLINVQWLISHYKQPSTLRPLVYRPPPSSFHSTIHDSIARYPVL